MAAGAIEVADPADAPADRVRARLIAFALAAATLILYSWRLNDTPIHLHYDEIFFGLQGQSIQSTGRDLNGLWLPVYFQLESTMNWYQPVGVYATALVLAVAPLSEAAIRFPAVIAGVINVVLLFFLARRLFRGTGWAVVAALLLMLTPAHFIHSRVAMDYVYPLPFLVGWAWCMACHLQRPTTWMVMLAATLLGLGFFSYIAGTALSMMYLAATLVVLWYTKDVARIPPALVGFAWPLAAAAVFLVFHPTVVPQLMDKYGLLSSSPSDLDPMQTLRESFNRGAVSDALNRYWRFFSPGYLFATGGSNLTNSTREAGVFLPVLAPLMLAGLFQAALSRQVMGAIVIFGFLSAPIPAAMLPEEFAIDRQLIVVPFAVLLATMGAEWVWRLANARPIAALTRGGAGALALVAIVYGLFTLMRRGEFSSSTPILIVGAIGLLVIGEAIERRRNWAPAVAALLLLVPVMFVPFVADYFDGYRMRSSGWFGGNIRGAIDELIRMDDATKSPEIHLSTDIPYIRSYWKFYLMVRHREDLAAKTKIFDGRTVDPAAIPPSSLVLAAANDPVTNGLAADGDLARAAAIKDRVDSSDAEQFVIFRRRGPASP